MRKHNPDMALFEPVTNTKALGKLLRNFRAQQNITLERVVGIANVGMRFLSELERGKETAQLGKVIKVLNTLGLEIIIRPRGQKRYDKA